MGPDETKAQYSQLIIIIFHVMIWDTGSPRKPVQPPGMAVLCFVNIY